MCFGFLGISPTSKNNMPVVEYCGLVFLNCPSCEYTLCTGEFLANTPMSPNYTTTYLYKTCFIIWNNIIFLLSDNLPNSQHHQISNRTMTPVYPGLKEKFVQKLHFKNSSWDEYEMKYEFCMINFLAFKKYFCTSIACFLSDLHGGLVLVLSLVGLLSSQALAMLSVFFASEVMPTVVR